MLPFREELTQQHGFVHAGIITAIADSACGYAALSLMPPGVGVLTIEFKVNLLNPAAGVRFVARGQVVKPGRTIMVCTGYVIAERGELPTTRGPIWAILRLLRQKFHSDYVMMKDDRCTKVSEESDHRECSNYPDKNQPTT